jgi:hypothetical protein
VKRSLFVVGLVLGVSILGGGAALAQSPEPSAPALPSYVPMPAADPVAAANAYLDAFVAKDWGKLPALTCSSERESIANRYDPAAQTFFPAAGVQALMDGVTVAIADRSVTLETSDAETATVKIGGTVTWSVADDALHAFIDSLAAQQSPAPSDTDKEQLFQMLKGSIESQVMVTEATVVKEDGGWLMCTDVMVTPEVSPAPSPIG